MIRPYLLFVLLVAGLVAVHRAWADEPRPVMDGYATFAEFEARIGQLAERPDVTRTSLAQTPGGHDVWLLTLSRHDTPDEQPAILVLGNVYGPQLMGGEVAERIAQRLVEQADEDEKLAELLERVTFYIIPRPSPDANAAFFTQPYRQHDGNARRTDDDRDGQFGEDPPEDLDGDGFITQMRVADPGGRWVPHPQDDRVLVEADPARGEVGQYRLLSEGVDNDEDSEFNEDPGDGVSFNRNWTFKYPFFKPQAGPHQVSEPETRAVADFAFDRVNIAVVFCFSPEDNLFHPWKPDGKVASQRIKTHMYPEDAKLIEPLLKRYRQLHGGKDAPPSPAGAGSFSEWAYFHYGRPSFAARGWWIPKVALPDGAADAEDKAKDEQNDNNEQNDNDEQNNNGDAEPADEDNAAKKPEADKRGELDRQHLQWFEREGIAGFSPWQAFEHPDFPGQQVEIGGFRPFYRLNPPAGELDPLAKVHTEFLVELTGWLPKLEIAQVVVKPLGGEVFQVTAKVRNLGRWPTFNKMGEAVKTHQPVQIAIELPEGATLVTGAPRRQIERLEGGGGWVESEWIVSAGPAATREARLRVWAPAVGEATHSLELKE